MLSYVHNVLVRERPDGAGIPLVLDSPHSGIAYPPDFGFACPLYPLRTFEDCYVEELYASAPSVGATLIHALFPRTYVDPNRDDRDLDPALLASPWPEPLQPTVKSERGIGLLFRRLPMIKGRIPAPLDVYDRKLTVDEVRGRIERYWRPYHDTLAGELQRLRARFGVVYHLDCHTCNPQGTAEKGGEGGPNPDVCLSDRGGTTCSAEFLHAVRDAFELQGFGVQVNDPFFGEGIVQRYGSPGDGIHSLQIELNRKHVLDLATFARIPEFARTQSRIAAVVAAVARWVRERAAAR